MHAWNLIPAFLIGLALTAPRAGSAGSSALPAAATDSCGPSFLEIYDFGIGDVFEYLQSDLQGVGSINNEWKFTIVSKERLADGYRYGIEEMARKWASPPFMSPTATGKFSRSVDVVDSTARRALNACKDEAVAMLPTADPPLAATASSTGFYTRIHIAMGDSADFPLSQDTTRVKILGGPFKGFTGLNLYKDPAGKIPVDSALSLMTVEVAAYAAGLGQVSGTLRSSEGGESRMRLWGYRRNGISHGIIDPDSAFGVTLGIRPAMSQARRSPDRLRFTGDGQARVSVDGVGGRNLIGRQVRALPDHHSIH